MKKQQAARNAARMTPQRAEILRLLAGNKSHPSAEDIYARISRKFPGISFATVYNNLQRLLSEGDLLEIRIDRSRSRFDPGLAPHAHLLCTSCGAIYDLPLPRQPRPPRAPAGFRIERANVEFFGTCGPCARTHAHNKEKKSCAKRTKK